MPTIEERVAYLEGRMQDHTSLWDNLRDSVGDLRTDMNGRFDDLRADMNGRFDDLRADMNGRFEDIRADMNRRFGEVRTEFGEVRTEIGQLRIDLHRLDDKVDRHFLWLAGTLITSVLVMMGGIVGLYFK